MQLGNFIDVFLAPHVSGTYAHHQEHWMLSCSIWFSAPSFWMGGGLEGRCVGRVYGADGAVRLTQHHPHHLAQDRQSLTFEGVQTNKWMSSIQNYHELTCFSAPPGLASQPRAQLQPRGALFSPIPSAPSLVQIRVSQPVRKIPCSFLDSVWSILPSYVVQQVCFWASHYLPDA